MVRPFISGAKYFVWKSVCSTIQGMKSMVSSSLAFFFDADSAYLRLWKVFEVRCDVLNMPFTAFHLDGNVFAIGERNKLVTDAPLLHYFQCYWENELSSGYNQKRLGSDCKRGFASLILKLLSQGC